MAEDTNMIRVWAFSDAPEVWAKLSGHGGDEDWLAHVPASFRGSIPTWMDAGTSFGCCDVFEYPQPDGSVVVIGAHA